MSSSSTEKVLKFKVLIVYMRTLCIVHIQVYIHVHCVHVQVCMCVHVHCVHLHCVHVQVCTCILCTCILCAYIMCSLLTKHARLLCQANIKKKVPLVRPRTIAPTFSRPMLDPEALSADMGADIIVGGVSCTLLFKFVTTLQVSILYTGLAAWLFYWVAELLGHSVPLVSGLLGHSVPLVSGLPGHCMTYHWYLFSAGIFHEHLCEHVQGIGSYAISPTFTCHHSAGWFHYQCVGQIWLVMGTELGVYMYVRKTYIRMYTHRESVVAVCMRLQRALFSTQ